MARIRRLSAVLVALATSFSFTTGAQATGELVYHGGYVETYPKIYVDFWGPEWDSGFSSCAFYLICYTNLQARRYIVDFAEGLGGSSWEDTLAQYGVHNQPGQFKAWWVDTTPVPPVPTESEVQGSAERTVSHFGVTDPSALVVVVTPHGKNEAGFGQSFWASHNTTPAGTEYVYLPYMPDCSYCERNYVNADDLYGHGWFDGFSIAGGHEIAEAVTDPHLFTGWWTNGFGEVGDPCQPPVKARNVTLADGRYFAMQPLWSNADGGCVL